MYIPVPKKLNVFFFKTLVGHIEQQHGKMSFFYDEDHVRKGGMPISLSMPVRNEPYDDYDVRAVFGNLLPEGKLLKIISKRAQFDKRNVFALLWTYGRECAGALSITEDETVPEMDDTYEDITEKLKAFFLSHEKHEKLFTAVDARLSLAGGMDKLPVKYDGSRFFIPKKYAPTTHVLKPDSEDFSSTVRNEALCMDIAEKMGLPVCGHDIVSISNVPVYLAERFDRLGGRRMHQEDICQAMGLGSDGKYQSEGQYEGAKAIVDFCAGHGIDASEFFEKALLANAIIGNMDGHLKNFSILYDESPRMAPLYDVLCTTAYPNLARKFAISIGEASRIEEVDENAVRKFSEDVGVDCGKVREDAVEMAETALSSISGLVRDHKERYGDNEIYEIISKEISNNAQQVAEKFSAIPCHDLKN